MRISAILYALADQGVVCSVDAPRAATALRATDAGAAIINGIPGGRWDLQMNTMLAKTGLVYVAQHYRALPGMPSKPFDYGEDLMGTLRERISVQVRDALDVGVTLEVIVIDPRLGFSLTNEQCHAVLDGLDILSSPGHLVLIGALWKRFIAAVDGNHDEQTSITTRRCAREGIWTVRAHEVRRNARVVREGDGVGR